MAAVVSLVATVLTMGLAAPDTQAAGKRGGVRDEVVLRLGVDLSHPSAGARYHRPISGEVEFVGNRVNRASVIAQLQPPPVPGAGSGGGGGGGTPPAPPGAKIKRPAPAPTPSIGTGVDAGAGLAIEGSYTVTGRLWSGENFVGVAQIDRSGNGYEVNVLRHTGEDFKGDRDAEEWAASCRVADIRRGDHLQDPTGRDASRYLDPRIARDQTCAGVADE